MENCNRIQELFSDYIDNILSRKEKEEIQTHISGCPKCKKELELFEKTIECLRKSGEEAEIPVSVQNIWYKLEDKFDEKPFLRRLFPLPVAISSAAIVVILLVFMIVKQRPDEEEVVSGIVGKMIACFVSDNKKCALNYFEKDSKALIQNQQFERDAFLEYLRNRIFGNISSMEIFAGKSIREVAYKERDAMGYGYSYVSARSQKVNSILKRYGFDLDDEYCYISMVLENQDNYTFILIKRGVSKWKVKYVLGERGV